MCNCKSYIGVFCTTIGGTVFAFVQFSNGVPTFTYYDTISGDLVTDPIVADCASKSEVQFITYNISDANVGQNVFNEQVFGDIKLDAISGLYKVLVLRDTKVQYENQPINSYTVDTNLATITLDTPLNSGEQLLIVIL